MFFSNSDRYFDGDIFMNDAPESERDVGIENSIGQNHPLRSRENLYEYRDSPAGKMTKLPIETASLRSPSSIAITQTTKSGSQSSLRSAISLKENPNIQRETNFDKNIKYSEKMVDDQVSSKSGSGGKYEDNKNLLGTYDKRSREFLTSSPVDGKPQSTPVPAARKTTAATLKSSRTHLIEGIPQTEV